MSTWSTSSTLFMVKIDNKRFQKFKVFWMHMVRHDCNIKLDRDRQQPTVSSHLHIQQSLANESNSQPVNVSAVKKGYPFTRKTSAWRFRRIVHLVLRKIWWIVTSYCCQTHIHDGPAQHSSTIGSYTLRMRLSSTTGMKGTAFAVLRWFKAR